MNYALQKIIFCLTLCYIRNKKVVPSLLSSIFFIYLFFMIIGGAMTL